jgi:hypothetical protein
MIRGHACDSGEIAEVGARGKPSLDGARLARAARLYEKELRPQQLPCYEATLSVTTFASGLRQRLTNSSRVFTPALRKIFLM